MNLDLLVGVFIGASAMAAVAIGVSAESEEPLTYTVRHRPSLLPLRRPGATLDDNPVVDVVHVTVKPWWRIWIDRATEWLERRLSVDFTAAFDVLQTDMTQERKRQTVHGRHRLDELRISPEWRSRWAAYDTQSWPTLELNPYDDRAARCRDHFPVDYLDAPPSRPAEPTVPLTPPTYSPIYEMAT